MQDDVKSTFERVGDYYADTAVRCWEIASRGHLHGGYWDETNADGEPWEGALRLTELMIGQTAIAEGERFVDIGSGLGLPGILLAQRRGCFVEGVNASADQVEKANASAEAEGVADRVRFQVADALAMPWPDATFDGGWFLESIFHMDRAAALREARRVLKPGATLLITDFVNHENTSEEFLEFQRDILLAEHGASEAYPALLRDAGFELLELTDMTKEVIIGAETKNSAAFELHRDEMLDVAGDDYLPFVQEVATLFAKNVGYVFVKAKTI